MAARCRENWQYWLGNYLCKTIHCIHGSCVPWKLTEKSMLFTAIRHSYKTLVRKKTTALTAARCRENYLRKVCFFTAIRHSYKTLVRKKNHGTHGSKVPWKLSEKKPTAATAARCREKWQTWLVNNFSQKTHVNHGSCVPWKIAEKSTLFHGDTAQL